MSQGRAHRHDVAHHHPRVHRAMAGGWAWECSCGGASERWTLVSITWRQAVIGALNHSCALAA